MPGGDVTELDAWCVPAIDERWVGEIRCANCRDLERHVPALLGRITWDQLAPSAPFAWSVKVARRHRQDDVPANALLGGRPLPARKQPKLGAPGRRTERVVFSPMRVDAARAVFVCRQCSNRERRRDRGRREVLTRELFKRAKNAAERGAGVIFV